MPTKRIKKRSFKKNKTMNKRRSKTMNKHKNKKNDRHGGNGDFEYISNLDNQETDILRKYTERHDLYPLFMRSNKNYNPLYNQSNKNYKPLYDQMNELEIYDIEGKIDKLNELVRNINIIDNIMTNKAPIVKQDIIVYRGTKNTQEDAPYLGVNEAYISTSKTLDALSKNTWRFLEDDCCIYKITIKTGVPYINLSKISYFGEQHTDNQEEILLPRGLKTTLESVSETYIKAEGATYKTYNVVIELNNQDKYSVEPIEQSPQIQEVFTIFQKVKILFDIAVYMNQMSNNTELTTENREKFESIIGEASGAFDFYNVNTETIDDILIQKYPYTVTIKDYNNYLKDLLKDLFLSKVISKDDKNLLNITSLMNQLQK